MEENGIDYKERYENLVSALQKQHEEKMEKQKQMSTNFRKFVADLKKEMPPNWGQSPL